MRKLSQAPIDGPPPPRRLARNLAAIAAGLLISPLLFEGSQVCLARWQGMFGPAPVVETPLCDALIGRAHDVLTSGREAWVTAFHRLPWRRDWILGIAAAWALCGSLLLRYGALRR